jgi:hypothetical protein
LSKKLRIFAAFLMSTGWLFVVPTEAHAAEGLTAQVYNVLGQNNAPYIPQGASPILTTNVPNINFQWGSGSVLGGPSEDVIVVFTGSIRSDVTQNISFLAIADDGTRLYIDGALVTDDWFDKGGGGTTSSPIPFTAGVTKSIQLMYYENGGGANVFLHWDQSGSMDIIPASAFTSQAAPVAKTIGAPRNLTVVDGATATVLTWEAPNTGNTQPERYAISFSADGGGWGIATGNVGDANALNTTITIPHSTLEQLKPSGTVWSFSIRSDNDTLALYSESSNVVTLKIGKTAEEIAAEAAAAQAAIDAENARLAAIAAEAARVAEIARLAEVARLAEIARLEREAAALLAAQQEAARLAAEQEAARLAELERQRLAAIEAARIAAEQEAARLAAIAAAEAEAARQAAIAEAARIEAERQAAIAAENARLAEIARLAAIAEAARVEAERVEQERLNELARIAAEKAEADRIAAEKAAAEAEAARIAAEEAAAKAEAERIAAEEAAAKAEADRIAAEEAAAKAEAERLAAEAEAKAKAEEDARLEAERIAAEEAAAKAEADRIAAEEAAEKAEADRIAAEEAAAKAEADRLAAEEAAAEAEANKLEAEAKAEAERLAAEEAAEEKALEDAAEAGTLTEEQKEIVVDKLIENLAPGEALTAEDIQEAGIEYKDLPPETPVEVRQDENGNEVIITADVAAALVLLENPAELIGAIFDDPSQALQALGSIGADMSTQEREEATDMVVATVIAAGAAMNAVAAAAGTTGGTTSGGSTGGGGGGGGGGASGQSGYRRKP